MDTDTSLHLSRLFNPANRTSVVDECFSVASEWLDSDNHALLLERWKLTKDLFSGDFEGYSACNTEYHDFSHTCDVVSATIRLCDGAVTQKMVTDQGLCLDLCTAAMIHDSGYIQKTGDTTGSGAKYTKTHVVRSIAFITENRERFGLEEAVAERIGRLVSGTDLSLDFTTIPFAGPEEKMAAELLASADLLGQMADRTYLEKLLFLYYEFKEAGFPGYDTEFDMLRKTLGFYESTKVRLFRTLGRATGMAEYHFFRRYGIRENFYIESIERQIHYLQTIIDDTSANFRKKLKRIDLEEVTRTHQNPARVS
jgi:hypothetical protein